MSVHVAPHPAGAVQNLAQPILDICHTWLAPSAVDDPGEAARGSLGARSAGVILSRCRLRIFRNGSLGRVYDWAVLISELSPQPGGGAYERLVNPGVPARAYLDQLATEIHRLHLARVPPEEVAWFYYQAGVVFDDRPRIHNLHAARGIYLVAFSSPEIWSAKAAGKLIYFGYVLEPVSIQGLEICAEGRVAL